jgi:SAM-dependent methyltransferase
MSERRGDGASEVLRHYEPEPLKERLLEAVAAAGIGAGATPEELAAWDQFHLGGLPATAELADALAPEPGAHVLDLGSGLGGPARLLSARHGCRVTGVDLSGEFVDSANARSPTSPAWPTGSTACAATSPRRPSTTGPSTTPGRSTWR